MAYKNSIRVFFSNFNIVWKMALYFLVVSLICFGLLFLCLNPVIKLFNEAGFWGEFVELYSDFLSSLNLAESLEKLSLLLDEAFEFFVKNFSNIWINIIGVIIVLFFLNAFLYNLSNMASCMSLHFYIGSLTRQGFFGCLSENFGRNLKMQLCNYFITMPLNILYIYLFILSLKLFGISWIINIVAIFVIIVCFVLLLAFKWTLFATWTPTMVVMNYGVLKSLKVSIKTAFKRFGRVFSNAVGLVLTIVVVNIALGLFTFLVGLIVSVPVSFLLYNAFGMVLVYEGQGMRYYVDIYNVITPNKKEISDKFKEMKYLV